MGVLLFFAVLAALAALVWRFRQPPAIYMLAVALWIGAYVWNMVITASCDSDCNIRVDLVFILPVVLFASILAAKAFMRSA